MILGKAAGGYYAVVLYIIVNVNSRALYTEFLRHLSMTAQLHHQGLAVGNFAYSLQAFYVPSLFTQ